MTDEEIVQVEEVFFDAYGEMLAQNLKWGKQRHPGGNHPRYKLLADAYREQCERHTEEGKLTWADILLEEIFEALSSETDEELETELTQCIAVIVQWKLDRRNNAPE